MWAPHPPSPGAYHSDPIQLLILCFYDLWWLPFTKIRVLFDGDVCRREKQPKDTLGIEKPSSSVVTDDVEEVLSTPNVSIRKNGIMRHNIPGDGPVG